MYIYIYIGVRGFPNGLFNPWARWITWPGLGREFFRRRRRRRRRRRPPKISQISEIGFAEQDSCKNIAFRVKKIVKFLKLDSRSKSAAKTELLEISRM